MAVALGVVRQWVRPRSLLLHLAFAVIASGCLLAGWWQVHRAMEGNTLSYLYSVEWPAFAVVAGIGWWQLVHDTPEDIVARKRHHAAMREASAAVVARTLPRSALAITVESGELGPGTASGAHPALDAGGPRVRSEADLVPVRQSPDFTALEQRGSVDAALLNPDEEAADPFTEYNRYLALLAVRGRAKTWRNPHGT